MQYYGNKFTSTLKGEMRADTPFIIASMEIMANTLRQQIDEEDTEVVDSLKQIFRGVMIAKE